VSNDIPKFVVKSGIFCIEISLLEIETAHLQVHLRDFQIKKYPKDNLFIGNPLMKCQQSRAAKSN
jgi:hypothetical protein